MGDGYLPATRRFDYVNGLVDDVGIWNRALITGEIADLYNGGIGITWDGTFTSIQTHPTLRSGMVAHYKLDGNGNDALGNYNGTLTGTTSPGKLGQCINSTGSNNYVTLPSGMNPTPYVSVVCWARRAVLSSTAAWYLKGDTTSIWAQSNGCVRWRIQSSTGVTQFDVPSNDLNWHLYAGTFDGEYSRFSIDGAAFIANARTGTVNSSEIPRIAQNYTNGSVDSVSIWNRPLAQSEVTDLYNGGAGLKYDAADQGSLEFFSAQSGDWSNPATWGSLTDYPIAGAVATVNTGHTVQIDGNHTVGHAPNDSAYVLTVYGTLKWKIQAAANWTFNCRGSVQLRGGGLLQIGSESEPIPSTQKANFIFEKSTSTATVMYLTVCNLTWPQSDTSWYGSVSIYGTPSYHMASAAMQRTTLAAGVTSGSDKTIIFADDVDYSVGDTIWIGYAGDPSIDPFNGTGINALYGSDTVTIKTKVDARTYTVDLSYTHVVGDFVIHKSRNVTFGGVEGVSLAVCPYLYIYTNVNDGNGPYLDKWNGTINIQWANLVKFEELLYNTSGCGLSDARIPVYKNCILQAPVYLFNFDSCTEWPWLDETVPHIDEVHVFGMTGNVFESNYGFGTGTMHLGHLSLVDVAWAGSDSALFSMQAQDGRGDEMLEVDSLWVSWARGTTFNVDTRIFYWGNTLKIYSMKARAVPRGIKIKKIGTEGAELFLNDCQIQHLYGYLFDREAVSGGTQLFDITCVNCKFSNVKTAFTYYYTNWYTNLTFNSCDFDGIAGEFVYAGGDGSAYFFELNYKFVNCRIGMMNQNTNMIHLDNTWFRSSGRILFENCQIRKPANVTASGTWTGIKGYCVRMTDGPGSYPGYFPTDKIYRQIMPPLMTYEWINCQIYDDNGIDQFAIEYPSGRVAVVGGGGELYPESSVIIDGSFAVKMFPYAVHGPHSGTQALPLRIPLLKGEEVTLKMSLRKNYSLPTGKRPTFNARGCGIDSSVEMTDVIDSWEELTITGTALYEDTLEVWVTGGWNLYAGTSDDYWEPMALGTIVSYADKFSCARTAAAAPKVLSAASVALNKIRLNFDRPLRLTDAMYESGVGINETSLTTGMIVHYKFDSNLNDSGPNALNGTAVNGPLTHQAGKISNGVYLNGSAQGVSGGTNALWNPTNISMFAWVKKGASGHARIFHKPRSGDHIHYGLKLYENWNGSYMEEVIATWINIYNDGGNQFTVSVGPQFSSSDWHFVGVTFDGSYVKIYLDGRLVLNSAFSGTLISVPGTGVYFGCYHNGGEALTGMLDELIMHSRALTANEIEILYNDGKGRAYTDSGSSIYSISGGKFPVIIETRDRESVEMLIDSDMTPGGSYTAGVVESAGLIDAYGVALNESYRSAAFTCYNSISTHPTLPGSLCGAWLLDGNADDSSGNGYHGTVTGTPSYVSGKIGQGLNFAGTAGNGVWINPMYLDRKKLGNITNFFVSCWAKFNAVDGSVDCLVSKYSTETKTNVDNEHWLLYKNASNYLVFEMNSTGSTNVTGPVATTNWTHLAAGFDGRTMVLYVNGVLAGTTVNSQPRNRPTFPLIPIRLGCCGVDADPPYAAADITYIADAVLDQVLFFNRLLTPDEVKAIYNSGNGLAF